MITQAAIMDVFGKIWTLPRPNRHSNIIELMARKKFESIRKSIQGFIDENGKFYTRKIAWVHAIECKQPFYVYDPSDTSKR